jgi:spore coat polysaccharide biosynthesis predicted glycosyltransferase SpsG
MNRAPVLFRVDAGPPVGYESLYRCVTFAAALQRRRRPAHFLSQLDPNFLAMTVKRGGNDWIAAANDAGTADDLADTIREVRRLQPAAVVVDAAAVTEDYLNGLRQTGVLVMSFDTRAEIAFPSRLVVNPLLGPSLEAYEHGRGTQLLLGRRYALIRPEIRRVRPLRAREPVQPFRALVALGDDDVNNRSAELAKALLNCPRVARVDVAVRPTHRDLANLKALAEQCPERLAILSEPGEVPPRVVRCHFAVTAGNSWSLELACVGVPQLMIVQSELHWPTAQRLEEEGAATCLGWHDSVSAVTLRQAVNDLLGDALERQAMARCGRKLIDGRGLDRLVTALEMLLHKSPQAEMQIAA